MSSPTKRGRPWRRARAIRLRAFPICEMPGCAHLAEEVDHRVPLSAGGTHAYGNLQSLCSSCHAEKTRRERAEREAERRAPIQPGLWS